MPVSIRLTGPVGQPSVGAVLICQDSGVALGTTDDDGIVRVSVDGKLSPGCGFVANCQVAYFRTEENDLGRPFWFGRLIRGSSKSTSNSRIEIVEDGV